MVKGQKTCQGINLGKPDILWLAEGKREGGNPGNPERNSLRMGVEPFPHGWEANSLFQLSEVNRNAICHLT